MFEYCTFENSLVEYSVVESQPDSDVIYSEGPPRLLCKYSQSSEQRPPVFNN